MKKIVVTGGSKGIGRAIVEKFAQENFEVFMCSRKEADLKKLADDLSSQFPKSKIHWISADLSEKLGVKKFADFIKTHTQEIDILVNNAGFFIPGEIQNEPEGTLETMIQTNLYSAYYLTRELLPLMLPYQKGHIFMVCSTASIVPYTNGGSYCISKFALYGMTKVLRAELKTSDIRVTALLPGATLTDSWNGVDLPESRFMKSSDIADTIFMTYQLSKNTVIEEIILRPQLGDI
jgi:short-subunit dehydrogenase